MSHSPTKLQLEASDPLSPASQSGLARYLWRDRLLRGAVLITVALITFQLGVTLLQPTWKGPVTDWLRAAQAWPELLVVVFVSLRLSRARHQSAATWWMLSAAMLSYTVARNLWTVYDQLIFPNGVPFPTFPDIFFVLQYPFFFLAVILMPGIRSWGPRLKVVLDGVLWMGAATALSWYFILQPIYNESGEPPLGKLVSLAYPVGDLAMLFGLTMALTRQSRSRVDRLVLYILCLAVVSLVIADSWVNVLLLYATHVYITGNAPDLFWVTFYLLVPLAGLVQLRLIRHEAPQVGLTWHEPARHREVPVKELSHQQLQRQDLIASLRFLFPFVAALLASAVIMIHAATVSNSMSDLVAPFAVSFGLLLLVVVRQEVALVENERLRREREVARANELAVREVNRRMEEFLSIASHELRTPLTSLQGNIQVMARRLGAPHLEGARAEELARVIALARTMLDRSEHSLRRIGGLVSDLLDDERIQGGHLEAHLEPCDLAAVIREAVEKQRLQASERTIQLELPEAQPVTVRADASRIGQVVTNYLTNALKYSTEEQPVTVRLQVEDATARVSVRDEGVGLPVEEQTHIWERFYRAKDVEVQSGSGVGMGIGLYISKSIIEGHGGQVGVHSAPGQGSTFWFTLPLTQASA